LRTTVLHVSRTSFFERRVVSHPFSRGTRLTLILAPDRL
jgi:hypothetical protein